MNEHKFQVIQLYCAGCGEEIEGESITGRAIPIFGEGKRTTRHYLWCSNCNWTLSGEDVLIELRAAFSELGKFSPLQKAKRGFRVEGGLSGTSKTTQVS